MSLATLYNGVDNHFRTTTESPDSADEARIGRTFKKRSDGYPLPPYFIFRLNGEGEGRVRAISVVTARKHALNNITGFQPNERP